MTAPTPQVFVQGQSSVTADNLNTFTQTAYNVAQLRTLTGVTGMVVFLGGTTAPGDGGSGNFYWATGTGYVDNGGSTTVVPTGVTTGAWLRLTSTGALASIVAGRGLTGGTITTSGTIGLAVPVSAANGGTGVANSLSATITLGGPVTFSGVYSTSFSIAGNTSLTLPQSGYVITTVNNMAANPVTGTPSSTTFLRGDGTWATVSGGVITLQVGATSIASGSSGYILYNNAGVLGNLATTGTGSTVVLSNVPTLVSPVLGTATATTINGNTLTAGTWTLTGGAGKTLTFNNSLTLAGTDGTAMTFPSTSATIARTDAAQTFSGTQTFSVAPILSTLTGYLYGNGSGAVTASTTIPASALSGILSPANGGTGIANNAASTLAISGAFATTFTVSAATSLTLPTSGTVTALGNVTTGSGNIVLATSPTLTTPVLGAATGTSLVLTGTSANELTAGPNGSTNPSFNVDASTPSAATGLSVKAAAAGSGLAVSVISSGTNESLTINARGSGTITLGSVSTGAIVHTTATTLSAALTYGGVTLSNSVTGTGSMVLSTSPTLTTPALGAATATTINGNTLTTGTWTLTGSAAKTLTFNNSLTLSGTDSTTMTFPSTSATIARTDAAQTFTGTQTMVPAPVIGSVTSSGTITPTTSYAQYNVTALAVSATIAAPTGSPSDGQKLILRIKDNGTSQTLTWTTTSNGYRAQNVILPTATVISTPLYVGCIWNSQDSFWDVVAVT